MKGLKNMKRWAAAVAGCAICFIHTTKINSVEAAEGLGGPPHIGTFEGSTTFTTSSSNGINPGLYLEVMDAQGNYTEYMSEDGVITIQNTKEGAYVTQAKLLGKTKYRDQDTGELLDQWEDGRNLKLESVQMPVLTTTGKNLFDESQAPEQLSWGNNVKKANVKENTTYVYSSSPYTGYVSFKFYDDTDNEIGQGISIKSGTSFTTPYNTSYLKTHTDNDSLVQIEEGTQATPYEPYKSNILSTSEDIELRGIGDVQDELNLLTGEVTSNTFRGVLMGSENWLLSSVRDNVIRFSCKTNYGLKTVGKVISDKFVTISNDDDMEHVRIDGSLPNGYFQLYISKDKIGYIDGDSSSTSIQKLKNWLQNHQIDFVSELLKTTTETVDLNSTYYFDPVLNREIRVKGTILPLVASVSIPTEPLSFLIDPNQAEGQQFIAPEFSITNQTPVPIDLNLKTFEQTTTILNDVLPETHLNWRQLNQKQSKDIALALVPQPSDGWLSLDEGPRYVADSSNYQLGEIKEESTVEFAFSALHGRAFVKELNPEYRLSFEFGFRSGD